MAEKLIQLERRRKVFRGLQQDVRDEEIAPASGERKDSHGADPGDHERGYYLANAGEHRGAVDPCGLLHIVRHGIHEIFQHPNAVRHRGSDIEQNDAKDIVVQLQAEKQLIHGNHDRRNWQRSHEQNGQHKRLLILHLIPGQRIGGQQTENDNDDGLAERHEETDQKGALVLAVRDYVAVISPCEPGWHFERLHRIGIDGRDQHPQQRKQKADPDDGKDQIRQNTVDEIALFRVHTKSPCLLLFHRADVEQAQHDAQQEEQQRYGRPVTELVIDEGLVVHKNRQRRCRRSRSPARHRIDQAKNAQRLQRDEHHIGQNGVLYVRDGDPEQDLQPGGAVDDGRFFDFRRHIVECSLEYQHRKGSAVPNVRQNDGQHRYGIKPGHIGDPDEGENGIQRPFIAEKTV